MAVELVLHRLTRQMRVRVCEVDEEQVIVGTARYDLIAETEEFVAHRLRVLYHLTDILLEGRVARLFRRYGFSRHDVHESAISTIK